MYHVLTSNRILVPRDPELTPKKKYTSIVACSIQCILCKAIDDVKHSKRLEQYICIELRIDDDDLNDRVDSDR